MSKIAGTLRILAVALPGFVLLPQAAADGVQKIGFINTERVYQESKQAQSIQTTLEKSSKAVKPPCKSCSRKARLWSKN